MGIQISLFVRKMGSANSGSKFLKETWSNQSVGPKMSRKFEFEKIKSRDMCEIFKTCWNFFMSASDGFDDKLAYIFWHEK